MIKYTNEQLKLNDDLVQSLLVFSPDRGNTVKRFGTIPVAMLKYPTRIKGHYRGIMWHKGQRCYTVDTPTDTRTIINRHYYPCTLTNDNYIGDVTGDENIIINGV